VTDANRVRGTRQRIDRKTRVLGSRQECICRVVSVVYR
jgi:hypothetical protein